MFIYKIYGSIHKFGKILLKRNSKILSNYKFINFSINDFDNGKRIIENKANYLINDISVKKYIYQKDVYPYENLVDKSFNWSNNTTLSNQKIYFAKELSIAVNAWKKFIENSKIIDGFRNNGLHYAGYILDIREWCLPSWIWTNAALVRYYCLHNKIDDAIELGDLLLKLQDVSGGWIVRNDYSDNGVIPQLAPNDSCYIALNCCLSLYEKTENKKYLASAIKCANWCISTADDSGIVYLSYNTMSKSWIKNSNIVDIGFTAGLFAKLYEITNDKKYYDFLKKFINAYIKLFYIEDKKCFCTSVVNNKQYGGCFARGQAWALEGLIPAYVVLKDSRVKEIINNTIDTLLKTQNKSGGWPYNLSRPLMGEDCKGIPVIAKNILVWNKIERKETYELSAKRAIKWCIKHTKINDENDGSFGGIYSYDVEGAIVRNLYSSTAFVYSNAYALETLILLDGDLK